MDQKISLIAAMSENRVIGRKNQLPWDMPADWAHFHEITHGKPFIMGRNSYEAPDKLLSTTRSIILTTHDLDELCPTCEQASSLEEALKKLEKEPEIFILGGQQVFEASLELANYIYLTLIHTHVEGDAFFPPFSSSDWMLVRDDHHTRDADNPHDYSFREYLRK